MAKTPRHTVAKVLATKSLGITNDKQFARHIAEYLLAEGRTSDVESLLRDIMRFRAEAGVVEVVAASAHVLTASIRAQIEAQVRAAVPGTTQVIISEELRPDMLGGVRLELPDQQFDLSIRSKLSHFKQLTAAAR